MGTDGVTGWLIACGGEGPLGGKGDRGLHAHRGVRAAVVVVLAPIGDEHPGVGEAGNS